MKANDLDHQPLGLVLLALLALPLVALAGAVGAVRRAYGASR